MTAFCLGIVLIGAILQAGGILKGNQVVFPGLPEIGQALFRLLGRSNTWLKIGTTMLHVAEALLISLAIKVSIGMFGRIQLKPMDTSPMMAAMTDIVNLCIPLTAAAGCIKGSEHIVQKLLA